MDRWIDGTFNTKVPRESQLVVVVVVLIAVLLGNWSNGEAGRYSRSQRILLLRNAADCLNLNMSTETGQLS